MSLCFIFSSLKTRDHTMTSETTHKAREKNAQEYRDELGKKIANLREEKQYSRETLAQKTKIPLHMIIKLEEGDKSFYKEKLYFRGFLNLICKEFKKEPAELLKQSEKCLEARTLRTEKKLTQKNLSQVKSLETKTLFGFKTLFLTLGTLVFLITTVFYQKLGDKHQEITPVSNDSFKKVTTKTPHILPPKEEAQEESKNQRFSKRTQEHQRKVRKPQEKNTQDCSKNLPEDFSDSKPSSCLSLVIKDTTNFMTKIDHKKPYKKYYEKGTYHFHYKETLDFYFLDASQIELIVKGQNWGPLSLKKEEKKLSFSNKKETQTPSA